MESETWAAPREYDSVFSIGSQCLTSSLLKKAGLKHCSGPFDWIFSNLRMVCDCIEDDFATFLDPAFFEPIPLADRLTPHVHSAHHAVYRARYDLPPIFNHHDPNKHDDFAYLTRCVNRLRNALHSGRPHLLLAISLRSQGGSHAFNRLCDLLDDMPAVEVCVLIARPPAERRAVELWEERGRHRLINLHVAAWSIDGLEFALSEDTRFTTDLFNQLIRFPE